MSKNNHLYDKERASVYAKKPFNLKQNFETWDYFDYNWTSNAIDAGLCCYCAEMSEFEGVLINFLPTDLT